MAIEYSGEGWTEPDPGHPAVLPVDGFLNHVRGFEFIDDPDHRTFRQFRPQIDVGSR